MFSCVCEKQSFKELKIVGFCESLLRYFSAIDSHEKGSGQKMCHLITISYFLVAKILAW